MLMPLVAMYYFSFVLHQAKGLFDSQVTDTFACGADDEEGKARLCINDFYNSPPVACTNVCSDSIASYCQVVGGLKLPLQFGILVFTTTVLLWRVEK
jgi:hypothetical protein